MISEKEFFDKCFVKNVYHFFYLPVSVVSVPANTEANKNNRHYYDLEAQKYFNLPLSSAQPLTVIVSLLSSENERKK